MEIALLILAFILLAAGLLGAVIPMIPGPPLSYCGLLVLHWSGHGGFSPVFLWVWAGITIAVTITDFLLPSLMAKSFGGSRAASIGSFAGLVAGMFFFPPLGLIIGPFLGALAGELIYKRTYSHQALKVAFGAFLSFIVGSGIKLMASAVMLFYAITAVIAG